MDAHHSLSREKSRPNHQGPTRTLTKTAPAQGTAYAAPAPTVPGRPPRLNTAAHGGHRHYNSSGTPTSQSPRLTPRPTLSREGSMDSAKRLVASQYLQDELERQRKAEVERSGHSPAKSSNGLSSPWQPDRDRQSSAGRSSDSDPNRPNSSETNHSKTNEMGLRDMCRTVDQLKNENFNLKFEVFHRREKQIKLETRVKELEDEETKLADLNSQLLEDLEKKDKAFQEAVAMIVGLEAKVDRMLRESDVVRRMEADPSLIAWFQALGLNNRAEAAEAPDVARGGEGEKTINRAPSFLSIQDGTVDNLREVYLNGHGSTLSLKRDSNVSPFAAKSLPSGVISPNFSNLSTSSFPSVYGAPKDNRRQMDSSGSASGPHTLDGVDRFSAKRQPGDETVKATKTLRSSTNRVNHSNSFSSMRRPKEMPSIQDIVQGSPLQRIERLDQGFVRDSRKPRSRGKDSGRPVQPTLSPMKRTRDDKKETLRRVTTEASGGVRLNDYALPPTPDTLSSGTLHRFKTSDETLGNRSDDSLSKEKLPELQPSVPLVSKTLMTQNTPTRDFSNSSSNQSTFFEWNPIPRPRSADETSSVRRGHAWDPERDCEPDAPSLVSSDIWMKESARPEWDSFRSTSPDLFGFPPTAGGWATQSFYARGGNHRETNLFRNGFFPIHDPLFTDNAPPAPSRRSSLHAHAAPPIKDVSRALADPVAAQEPVNHPSRRMVPFLRRNSDVGEVHMDMKTPVQGTVAPPPADGQKKNHYPPIAGQGGRSGLNRFFRRSIGGSAKSENAQGQTQQAPEDDRNSKRDEPLNNNVDTVGHGEDDDRGATPPPILMKPHHERSFSADHYAAMDGPFSGVPVTAAPNDGQQTPTQPTVTGHNDSNISKSATGSRRKWLPNFGRSNSISLKNRIG